MVGPKVRTLFGRAPFSLHKMSARLFHRAEPGDLLFFSTEPKASANAFDQAVLQVSTVDSTVFHVGFVLDATRLVHVTPANGVQVQPIVEAIADLRPSHIEVARVQVDDDWKSEALKKALDEVGHAEYNDLFAPDCLNSRRRRAFYCCQLVVSAFRDASPTNSSPFLPHSLNFKDASGRISDFWIDYYKQRNAPLPQGQPGSHPSKLRVSPSVQLLAIRPARMSTKLTIPRTFLKNLHYIGGSFANEGSSSSRFKVFEPRSGQVLTEIGCATPKDVDEVVRIAQEGQRKWAKFSWQERGNVLRAAATLIRENLELLGDWEVRDNGKPISEALVDISYCADALDYYSCADMAGRFSNFSGDDTRYAYTIREPFGVIGAIGAWNYPMQTATWKIAPALACGNAVIYKPSPLAPITSVLLAEILTLAGLPDGAINVIQGDGETGAAICRHIDIRKVSFTGSVATGKKIAQTAAETVKPVTLELGGKSSCIILDDADIETAVHGALMANFYSQGQVCSNATKVFVHTSLLDTFTDLLINKVRAMKIGDPLEKSTHVGASISADHVDKVIAFIDEAVAEGARKLHGGEKVKVAGLEEGFYLSPCILTNVNVKSRAFTDEIFGPVMLIIPFDDDEEALHAANDTIYGLGAGVFTTDLRRAHPFAARLHSGNVWVNTYNDVSPWVPFGGYKQSGYGRECGPDALDFYSQVKGVFMNASCKLDNPFPSKPNPTV